MKPLETDRRKFLAAAAAAALAGGKTLADDRQLAAPPICAFEKFLQALSYDELADTIADEFTEAGGLVGIEATVRKGGHVEPERVEEDLPKLVEALKKRDLEITIMASDVTGAEQPLTEKVLRTAADLGVKRYRMGYYHYEPNVPVTKTLEQVKPQLHELADFNRELGMQALYQNHSEAKYVGAMLWDFYWLVKDIPPAQVGSAFDIRHISVEAGRSWPTIYRLMKPHIGAVFVKDFVWDGPKSKHAPLGTGRVDKGFIGMIRDDGFEGPYSLHVEYLPEAGTQENIDAIRRDLKVLRGWLEGRKR